MAIQFINEQSQLTATLQKLRTKKQISLDLEFDKNYYRYGFNLCLMQLYDGSECYLIDPLSSDLGIETIFPVLESEEIQKVAFAFGEDLRLLHSLGCFPKNVYDLDNAISLLNYPPASLSNHLKDIIGVDAGKSSQMSNWYHRPLKEQQIEYAANDVRFLPELYERLVNESRQLGVTSWIEQENEQMTLQDFSGTEDNDFVKHKDKKHFTEKEWHLFVRLMETREQLAESLNRPSFKVIKKEILMDIAKSPAQLQNWTNTRGIHRRLRNGKIKEKLAGVLQEAEQEAKDEGLSNSESADRPPSPEERTVIREQREKVNRAKNELFQPIKEHIEQDYGKEVSTFLFSNRIISEIVTDEKSTLLEYKETLLKDYAEKLNLEVEKFLRI